MLETSVELACRFVTGAKSRAIKALVIAGVGALAAGAVTAAFAQSDYDFDSLMLNYNHSAKGKTVAFVPIAMTFSITQEYLKGFQAQADRLGYKLVTRDPNWSVDKAVQAIEELIAEKPDVIIAHPLDGTAFNRLVKKANDAGIYWIWANLKGPVAGDAFVGANFFEANAIKVRLAADFCAHAASKKVFLMQDPPTNYAAIAGTAGFKAEMKLHPELELVGIQTDDADSNKAHAIAATVLKQHPDLCAFIGQWDGADIGIPPAVAEAGLTGKVAVLTEGGGNKPEACDEVAQGAYTAYVDYNIDDQTKLINATVMDVLQMQLKPGSHPFAAYVENEVLSPQNVKEFKCWSVTPAK